MELFNDGVACTYIQHKLIALLHLLKRYSGVHPRLNITFNKIWMYELLIDTDKTLLENLIDIEKIISKIETYNNYVTLYCKTLDDFQEMYKVNVVDNMQHITCTSISNDIPTNSIGFGKYEKDSFKVMINDIEYVEWILKHLPSDNIKLTKTIWDIIEYSKVSPIINFGKYKGKSLSEIHTKDPNFTKTLLVSHQCTMGNAVECKHWLRIYLSVLCRNSLHSNHHDILINFGKYKDVWLSFVYYLDVGYINEMNELLTDKHFMKDKCNILECIQWINNKLPKSEDTKVKRKISSKISDQSESNKLSKSVHSNKKQHISRNSLSTLEPLESLAPLVSRDAKQKSEKSVRVPASLETFNYISSDIIFDEYQDDEPYKSKISSSVLNDNLIRSEYDKLEHSGNIKYISKKDKKIKPMNPTESIRDTPLDRVLETKDSAPTLNFGKYSGQSLSFLFETDRSYTNWIKRQSNKKMYGNLLECIQWINNKELGAVPTSQKHSMYSTTGKLNDFIIDFGKHVGELMSFVYSTDKVYIDFIKRQINADCSPGMLKCIEWVKRKEKMDAIDNNIENSQIVTTQEDFIINFGKYKYNKMSDVYSLDKGYCRWLLLHPNPKSENFCACIRWLQQHPF